MARGTDPQVEINGAVPVMCNSSVWRTGRTAPVGAAHSLRDLPLASALPASVAWASALPCPALEGFLLCRALA